MRVDDYCRAVCRDTPGMTQSARLVLWAMSPYVNRRTGAAWPSSITLTADTGLDNSTVRRGLYLLVELGVITRTLRPGRSTLYRWPIVPAASVEADAAVGRARRRVVHTQRASALGGLSTPSAPARNRVRASALGGARGRATEPRKNHVKEPPDDNTSGPLLTRCPNRIGRKFCSDECERCRGSGHVHDGPTLLEHGERIYG